MALGSEIKALRVRCFLSQEQFAREIGVAFSTVNRWERDKAKPNFSAMKKIDSFCQINSIDFRISDMILEEKNQ